MIATTTPGIDGHNVERYLGIVTGEAILGANIFRDMFANIRDLVGGRSAAYEKELAEARSIALQEMMERGQQMGANAIVGVDLDYEVLGQAKRDADGYPQRHGRGGEIGACGGVTYAQRTACFDRGVLLV